jgi:hypothetical protein
MEASSRFPRDARDTDRMWKEAHDSMGTKDEGVQPTLPWTELAYGRRRGKEASRSRITESESVEKVRVRNLISQFFEK